MINVGEDDDKDDPVVMKNVAKKKTKQSLKKLLLSDVMLKHPLVVRKHSQRPRKISRVEKSTTDELNERIQKKALKRYMSRLSRSKGVFESIYNINLDDQAVQEAIGKLRTKYHSTTASEQGSGPANAYSEQSKASKLSSMVDFLAGKF